MKRTLDRGSEVSDRKGRLGIVADIRKDSQTREFFYLVVWVYNDSVSGLHPVRWERQIDLQLS